MLMMVAVELWSCVVIDDISIGATCVTLKVQRDP
jgi:hypothetical protein